MSATFNSGREDAANQPNVLALKLIHVNVPRVEFYGVIGHNVVVRKFSIDTLFSSVAAVTTALR